MIRLDKYLAHMNYGTRREVKKIIRSGWVSVNGTVILNDDQKIDENKDVVCVDGENINYREYYYIMLNKPQGYISATIDERYPTVLDLIHEDYVNQLFPIGRLDLDSEGLLLLSNDGALSHDLLSPKKHIDKEYYVELAKSFSEIDMQKLELGVAINNHEICKEAKATRIDTNKMLLVIQEGKYHQVKRMMHAIDNEVIYLKRIRMGSLHLDDTLSLGEYRMLNDEEIQLLKQNKKG